MYEIIDVLEFEQTWTKMVEDFGLQDIPWLHFIYQLKMKWARCFMKDHFTLGIKSTQLSESLNSDLKLHMKCDMHLGDFFKQFDRVLESKRNNEKEADFKARQKSPTFNSFPSPLLQQAAHIYTPAIYSKFENEFTNACGFSAKPDNETSNMFTIMAHAGNRKEYRVYCDGDGGNVNCSCRKWEMEGLLYSHILKVFNKLDIIKMSEKYILSRWTRGARTTVTPISDVHTADLSQWVERVTSMVLRATYHVAQTNNGQSTEGRAKITDRFVEFCKGLYSLPLDGNPVREVEHGSDNAPDIASGLAKRSGKRKTTRYRSPFEAKGGKK